MKQPNILFVFTDDQRFDTISALGNKEIETPNIDRLVKNGTTFTQAHIMGGTHEAVCMPSRAMMLTGRTLFSIEQQGQCIPPEHSTMPEWFRTHGYTTAHIGKWHQDRASHARSFSTGAKIYGFKQRNGWYEACNGHWHTPLHDFDPLAKYDPDGGYNDPPIEPFTPPFETVKKNGKHSVDVFSEAAREFIRDYPKSDEGRNGKPFFLYLAHTAPHDPRQYPAKFRERYNAETVSLPPNFATAHPFDNGELVVRDELLAANPRHPNEVRQHLADYYALIAYIDEQLGHILETLEESGQADNTIIVFAGDNGLAVGQHGLMGKQNLYDHSLRVPLIFAGPGIPKDCKTDAGCYLLDIFPTLCELINTAPPESSEGISLVPAMQAPSNKGRQTMHFAYKGFQRAVRQGDHKLIEYVVDGNRTTQLFDLRHDPYETTNLTDKPELADKLKSLRTELKRWQTEFGDTQAMGQEFWRSI